MKHLTPDEVQDVIQARMGFYYMTHTDAEIAAESAEHSYGMKAVPHYKCTKCGYWIAEEQRRGHRKWCKGKGVIRP